MIRLYRLLLRAYPRWFRARYEAEMTRVFAEARAERRYSGPLGRMRFWLHILGDLCTSGARLRVADWRGGAHGHPRLRRVAMDTILQDIEHAVRGLAQRPAFTAVAVLSLAIGIGGSASIHAFLDGYVLNPFPYPEPDRVVAIGVTFPRVSGEERFIEAISPLEFADIQAGRAIERFAAFDLGNRNLSGGDRPERVLTCLAQTDLFGPFGLRPALGRGFTAEELAPGGSNVAVISHRLWLGRFGGDPAVIGRVVRVNGLPTTVVGVMPAELLVLGADLWLPWGIDPLASPRNLRQLTIIGRLAPGRTLQDANAELATIANRVAAVHGAEFSEYEGWRLHAEPWAQALMRDLRSGAFMLLGSVTLVLLIACVNLSNLVLARSSTRQREVAVRLALGAARSRIARHLLTEVAVLALLGAVSGLLFAHAALGAIMSVMPSQAETLGVTATLNARVLAWTAVTTIGSALIVALLPVFQSSRTDPQDALRADGRGTTPGRASHRLRHTLIVAEVALSALLLCGAGLLMRSYARLEQVEPGLDTHNVLTMRLTVPLEKYRGAEINAFFQRIVDRLEETPGVEAASVASQFPPRGPFTTPFRLEGTEGHGRTIPTALVTAVSDGHFTTLGTPLVAGRALTDRDLSAAPRVAVVNEAFASQFAPGGSPLGKRLTAGPAGRESSPMEIVGVVGNTRNRGVRLPTAPEIFIPLHQQTFNNQMFLLVRTQADATAILPAVRQQLAAIDPDQPVYGIQTLEDAFSEATFRQRVTMILVAFFAAVAVSLAGIGIYGVMSYAVSARTQEIGVRMAVGADRSDVVWLVVGQTLRLTAAGLALGVIAVFAAGGALRRMLFEVRPSDPVALVGAVVVLGSVALAAAWLPAWRASLVDPVVALRYD